MQDSGEAGSDCHRGPCGLLRRAKLTGSTRGAQFTSEAFTGRLERAGVRVSMDGRGRVTDNIFIERRWRTLKYEDVHLRDYADGTRLRMGLESYFQFYNTERVSADTFRGA